VSAVEVLAAEEHVSKVSHTVCYCLHCLNETELLKLT